MRRLVSDGDYEAALKAMAVRLAASIDDPEAPPSARAAIARELRPVLVLLKEKSPEKGKGILDELADRRAQRSG